MIIGDHTSLRAKTGRSAAPRHIGVVPGFLAALASAAVVISAAAGCASGGGVTYHAVCEDSRTQVRVADQRCASSAVPRSSTSPADRQTLELELEHGEDFEWEYYETGQHAPAIGQRVTTGIRTPPEDGVSAERGGVPVEGGVVGDGSGSGDGSGDGGGDGGSGGGDGGGGGGE